MPLTAALARKTFVRSRNAAPTAHAQWSATPHDDGARLDAEPPRVEPGVGRDITISTARVSRARKRDGGAPTCAQAHRERSAREQDARRAAARAPEGHLVRAAADRTDDRRRAAEPAVAARHHALHPRVLRHLADRLREAP